MITNKPGCSRNPASMNNADANASFRSHRGFQARFPPWKVLQQLHSPLCLPPRRLCLMVRRRSPLRCAGSRPFNGLALPTACLSFWLNGGTQGTRPLSLASPTKLLLTMGTQRFRGGGRFLSTVGARWGRSFPHTVYRGGEGYSSRWGVRFSIFQHSK